MKKMIYKILSLCLACFILAVPMAVAADDAVAKISNVDVDYNRETGRLSIGAKAPSGINIEEPARVIILKPAAEDETIDDVLKALESGTKTFVSIGIHADETAIKDDYSFEFDSVTLPELPVGDYIMHMAAGDAAYTDIIAVATIEQALALMDNASDAAAVADYIAKYNDVYGLDTDKDSDYASLGANAKDYVLTNMCSVEYEDAEDMQERFDIYTQLGRVYEGPWGTAQKVIEAQSELLGISLTDYNKLSSTYKAEAAKALPGVKYADTTALKTAFDTAVAAALEAQEDAEEKSENKTSGSKGSGSVSMRVELPGESTQPLQPVVNPTEPFTDLVGSEWAKESIYELYEKGIVNGKAVGVFAPTDSITRAEAVKLIVMAFGGLDAEAEADFVDVSKDSWMYPYIATGAKRGIVLGFGDGRVGALDTVTREDFATMVMRAAKSYGLSFDAGTDAEFADNADINDYALEAVYGLKNAGVISGVGDNMYMPKGVTSRAQAAKIIAGLI